MSIKDYLNRAAEERPDAVALRFKRSGVWQTTSFSGLRERSWCVSELLFRLNVRSGDRVALFRENSPEWYELYHGIVGIGAIAVPLDAQLREQEAAHILHDCKVSVIFCSARLFEVLADMDDRLHHLQSVVVLDGCGSGLPPPGHAAVYEYDVLLREAEGVALSAERAYDRIDPDPDAPASFIYTSGTTGRQKGAMLTHRNFMSNVQSVLAAIPFSVNDNVLLILPLHHSFAFTTTLLLPVCVQCEVTLVENIKTIKSNMAETAPTIMLAVPLLLEKMLARIMDGIQSKPAARLMFRAGLGGVPGRKVKGALGGALRLIISGGAPISPATLKTWKKLGFCIIEGYGITETAPVLSVNPPKRPRVGTVGLPLDGVEIRIDRPDGEGVGEIVVRGDNVMLGYYNKPEETEQVLVDGWYHTGDLGRFDEKGYLVISGRKKSLIVNREGKNIYPEEIERQVMQSPFVLECLAMGYREPGEEIGERVGLMVVPNEEEFDALEREEGVRLTDRQIEERIRAEVREQLAALSDYKRPRRIEIRFDEFEKTSTRKIKRHLYAMDTRDYGRPA